MENPWWIFSFSTFIFVVIGKDYLAPLWNDIKHKNVSVTIFVVISSITAYVYSTVMFAQNYNDLMNQNAPDIKLFYDSIIEILVIIYLGNYIEQAFSQTTSKGLDSIKELYAKEAILLKNGKEIKVKPQSLKIGDIVFVRNGDIVPIDGEVIEGTSTINESTFTGESIPLFKEIGSNVIGGTISKGTIKIKITHLLKDSMLSQVVKGIEETKNQKTKTSKLALKISKFLLPLIFICATSALIGWSLTNNFEKGIKVFITALIVTCPMSLILLTPTATLVSSSISAKKGIVYNSDDILERVKKVDVIAFDKTGTLTEGKFSVISSTVENKYHSIVKTIENSSTHPIAKAICHHYNEDKLISKIKIDEKPGKGLTSTIKGTKYFVGSIIYLLEKHKKYIELEEIIIKRQSGSVIVYLWNAKEVIGYIELKDKIKPTAKGVIEKFNKLGVEVYMITGDNQYTAQYVASEVGIKGSHVYANTLPNQKGNIIRELQEEGKFVAFTGDGINDAIALEQANVGIAIGEGSSVAIDSSDITIQKNDLHIILESLWISNQTLRTIYFGMTLAICYNILVLALATSGILSPIFGAISMIINDTMPVMVSLSLYRLKKDKYTKDKVNVNS